MMAEDYVCDMFAKTMEELIQEKIKNDRYEWARTAQCFKNYRTDWNITFKAIKSKCKLIVVKEWEREYNLVNQLVHASSQGTFYRLGTDTSKVVPVGRSDSGMSISAIHSAISLVQITSFFFTVFSHGDSTISLITFRKWIDKIVEYYEDVE